MYQAPGVPPPQLHYGKSTIFAKRSNISWPLLTVPLGCNRYSLLITYYSVLQPNNVTVYARCVRAKRTEQYSKAGNRHCLRPSSRNLFNFSIDVFAEWRLFLFKRSLPQSLVSDMIAQNSNLMKTFLGLYALLCAAYVMAYLYTEQAYTKALAYSRLIYNYTQPPWNLLSHFQGKTLTYVSWGSMVVCCIVRQSNLKEKVLNSKPSPVQ